MKHRICFSLLYLFFSFCTYAEVHINGMMYYGGAILGPVEKSLCPNSFTIPHSVSWINQYGKKMGPIRISGINYREYEREGAFEGCNNLEEINLGSVCDVGYDAFRNCKNLKNVIINSFIEDNGYEYEKVTLNDHCFRECTSLESVRFTSKNRVIKLYNSVFENCKNLRSIDFGENIVDLSGEYIFDGCEMLSSLEFYKLSGAPQYALEGATNLANIYIKNGGSIDGIVYGKNYASYTLMFCPRGREGVVILPDSITYSLSSRSFQNCRKITSLTIGENCSSIESCALGNMISLKDLYIKFSNPYIISDRAFDFFTSTSKPHSLSEESEPNVYNQATLWVPNGLKPQFSNHPVWGKFKDIREFNPNTSVMNPWNTQVEVTVNGDTLLFSGMSNEEEISIYTEDGKLTYQGTSHKVSGLDHGLYIVKTGKYIKKIIL